VTQEKPLSPASDGRNSDGTFALGNRAGRGNPMARKAQQLRAAMFRAVTTADLRDVVNKLVSMAKEGDVAAAREVLQRCLGPAEPVVAINIGPATFGDYDVEVIRQQIIDDNEQLAQQQADRAEEILKERQQAIVEGE